jgi:hypothetical protein
VASYGTFSTGINIRNLHNVVFASPSKSKIRNLQSIGRVLRTGKNKSKATLYDIADDIWLKELKYTMKKTLIMNSLMSQSRRVMDKTEFLAAIKLVSGEELLSMVTPVNDENGDYLIVENPIEVEEVILPNKQAGAKVQPWMKFSKEDQFVIPKDKIITIVEVAEDVEVFYHMSLRKLNTDFITDAKGKISTVEEARAKLDKLFKNNS